MSRLKAMLFLILLAAAPVPALALTAEESIVAQLRAQGFDDLTVTRTWLGRIHILAISDDLRREIVFNPNTGEILRDYWQDLDGQSEQGGPVLADPRNGSDDGGNDREDDNSGSGNGNGSGDEDENENEDEHEDEDGEDGDSSGPGNGGGDENDQEEDEDEDEDEEEEDEGGDND